MRLSMTLVLGLATQWVGCSTEEKSDQRQPIKEALEAPVESVAQTLGVPSILPGAQLHALCLRSPATQTFMVLTDEGVRDYIVYSPKRDCSKRAPALMVFHGGYGDAAGTEKVTPFHAQADRTKTLIIYPNGRFRHWNDGRVDENGKPRSYADDVGFIDRLLDVLKRSDRVDMERIYATGHSNGGSMTMRLSCELAGRIAAFATNTASMPEPLENCAPSRPVPILMINGTADRYVPYEGGKGWRNIGIRLSVDDTIALYLEANGCSGEAVSTALADTKSDDTHSIRTVRSTCSRGARVEDIKVVGGGHTWPGAKGSSFPLMETGALAMDFDASRVIIDFLLEFSL